MTAKKPSSNKKSTLVSGQPVATLSNGFVLIKTSAHRVIPKNNEPHQLLQKAAKALSKPGIPRSAVFGDGTNKRLFSYSIDTDDPSRLVRVSFDGTRSVGRLVNGKFQAIKR